MYRQLKSLVLEKIEDILAVNTKETKELLDKYYEMDKKDVVKRLATTPELQLDYLEQVLEGMKEVVEKRDDNIVQMYLNLLCRSNAKEKRKQVLEKLIEFKESYQMDELLFICKDCKLKDAVIYLEEGLKNYEEALKLRIEVRLTSANRV